VVFSLGCGLFLERVREQARAFPDLVLEQQLVDTLAGNLVSDPERYDMVLTTNLFGDILADVVTAQVGAPTVPIVNANDDIAVFCPTHDAFDAIAGQQRINPLSMLQTLCAMLQWLSLEQAAASLARALASCDAALRQCWMLPEGMTTPDVTRAVVQRIRC
jgi:isocitrate/isopropylmalate dehydrogenase